MRIGSRHFVRNQVRKMWGAIYKELKDSNEENQVRASNRIKYIYIFLFICIFIYIYIYIY